MRINFGILGAGRISKIHCHNIYNNPKSKILKIYDINNKLSKSLARKYKTFACKEDLEIFKDPNTPYRGGYWKDEVSDLS